MREDEVLTNGISMHVVSRGAGRPVVFIHGLGWSSALWVRQLETLSGRYRVVAADTRGHGLTDKPDGPYTIAQFAADWAGMLDAIGLSRVCLVGFSQGGLIAQMIVLERPDLVGALVLAGTSCRAGGASPNMAARTEALSNGGPLEAARVAAAGIFSDGWRAANPAYVDDFVARRAAADPAPLRAAMAAAKGLDMSARLSVIDVPTLVIGAAEDRMMPPAATLEIAGHIAEAQTVMVPGCGHMIPIEQPAAFDAALGRFLQRHWPAA